MPINYNGAEWHPDQGMTLRDINATRRVARRRNEIIIFRSTGCWSRPHIANGHPTKPFAIKGKSSDWGPHAGFVPYDGEFSKEISNAGMHSSTKKNREAVENGTAARVPTYVSDGLINNYMLEERSCARRRAVDQIERPRNGVIYFRCTKPGSAAAGVADRPYIFMGRQAGPGRYQLFILPNSAVGLPNNLIQHEERDARPLFSMTVVGSNLPLTGDYDLFAICPSWGAYGKRDIKMHRTLDTPVIARSNARTQQKAQTGNPIAIASQAMLNNLRNNDREEPGMGNITPRIREVVMALQAEMGGQYPRVHHNAESGRPFAPPAQDGFPLTVIHPRENTAGYPFTSAIINDINDLRQYFSTLYRNGYYPPRNHAWGMRAVW